MGHDCLVVLLVRWWWERGNHVTLLSNRVLRPLLCLSSTTTTTTGPGHDKGGQPIRGQSQLNWDTPFLPLSDHIHLINGLNVERERIGRLCVFTSSLCPWIPAIIPTVTTHDKEGELIRGQSPLNRDTPFLPLSDHIRLINGSNVERERIGRFCVCSCPPSLPESLL
jgi:hypothetical protein